MIPSEPTVLAYPFKMFMDAGYIVAKAEFGKRKSRPLQAKRTIFPMCWLDSIKAWALAASANGKVR